jgi:hypothetical protein
MSEQDRLAGLEVTDAEGDDEVALQAFFHQRDLTDGLPVIVPTPERVEAYIAASGWDPEEEIGAVDPARGIATAGNIAVNALMAGCKPEHLGVVIAAIEAMLQPQFRMHGVQATTNPVAPLTIVNGPIRHRLDIDSGRNALAPGQHANGPIGRAIRFVMRNIGGAVGDVDRATLGFPGKYTFCLAEAEEQSPWEPHSVSLGFPAGTDVVSVVGVESFVNTIPVFHHSGPIIEQMARALRGGGTNLYWSQGTLLFVVNPGHATILTNEGYDRRRLQEELFERGKVPLADLPEGNIAQGEWKEENGKVLITSSPDEIWIVCAGGPEPLHTVYMTGFGVNNGAVQAVRTPANGQQPSP